MESVSEENHQNHEAGEESEPDGQDLSDKVLLETLPCFKHDLKYIKFKTFPILFL